MRQGAQVTWFPAFDVTNFTRIRVGGISLLLELIKQLYRAAMPLAFRQWMGQHRTHQAERKITVAGLLDRGFGITPGMHAELLANTPTIALFFSQSCSHKCSYCVSGMQHGGDRHAAGFLEEVGWERYGELLLELAGSRRVLFNFAGGGECAEHPDFVPLVRLLLERDHFVTIQTHGLSSRRIAEALKPFSREMLATVVIALSFHLGAYLEDGHNRRLDAWLNQNFTRLANTGATIGLIVPLTPKVLLYPDTSALLRQLRDRAKAAGVPRFIFSLVELHGEHDGRYFPRDYSADELACFDAIMGEFGNPNGRGDAVPDGASSIVLSGGLRTRGLPCYAHYLITEVMADGSLRHCQSYPVDQAGHLRDAKSLAPEPKAKPCPYLRCECISVGVNMALRPNGISIADYAAEIRRIS